jgi:hypothetical protein
LNILELKNPKTLLKPLLSSGPLIKILFTEPCHILSYGLKEAPEFRIPSSCMSSHVIFIPFLAFSLFFYQFYELSAGFKILTFFPLAMFYTRLRDKCIDPDIKEMWLRDFIHQNAELSKLFKPESIHVLDNDIEWDAGYPCEKKFPEFKNKFWRFFNSDTHMTTGFFKFGDLESGATMTLRVNICLK